MDYPATFELNAPLKVARWRVIGNIILAIPHMIVLYVLRAFDFVMSVFSWLSIVFIGRMPEGLATVSCMLIRYQARAGTFIGFLREGYPPMDFSTTAADNGRDPQVTVNITPELQNRSRLSVFFRLILLIPVGLAGIVWGIVSVVVHVVGFFAVLILGRWPEGMRNLLVGIHRFGIRTGAYGQLLTDKFPPLGIS